MGPIPFAFSVSHFINSVGADAGFASIIGLALLVLLYFAQARETASLRDQAYEAAQRTEQLEGRLAQLARSQAAAATPGVQGAPVSTGAGRPLTNPVPAARPAVAPPQTGTPAPAPVMAGAPAGVGAPALSAATRLIPGPAGLAPAAAASAPGATEAPSDLTTVGALAPATAAGNANGGSRDLRPPVTAGRAPDPTGQASVVAAQGPQAPPRVQIRPGGAAAAGRRPAPPPRAAVDQGRPRSGLVRVVAFAVAALVVVGVVAALLLLTGGSGSKPAARTSSQASNAPVARRRAKPASSVSPASVTVAVLNGTASSGLAHRVSVKLVSGGYKPGSVATASDQTRTATVVAFLSGHRREALAVASALKLGSASVQPVDANTQAVACPPPAACSATVFVTVGSDLANTP